jgi:hypothetical protein
MPLSLASFGGGGQQGGPFATVVSAAQNVANGNSIVVGGRWISTACTDNAGNTYIPLGHLIGNPTSNAGEGFDFWYCNNCIGNSALVVTLTLNSNHAVSLDTYTSIAVWNIAGGPLTLQQYSINVGSGTTTTYTPYPTQYPNSITCLLMASTTNLTTYSVTAPLVQDGGTSLGGQQIQGAGHAIYNSPLQSAQPLVSTNGVNGTWEMGGPVFGAPPAPLPTKKRIERFGPALFTGREYDYFITLEKVWPLS